MERILDAIDYIYFRIYKFFIVHKSKEVGEDEVRQGATLWLWFIFIIPIVVLVIAPLLRANGIRIPVYSVSRAIVGVILFVMLIPFEVRYWKKEKLQKLKERWGNEEPQKSSRRGWLVLLVIITNLIFIPMLVILLDL